MFHAKVMRFDGAILKNEVAVWGGWVMVMPPAAAVWGILSVEEEEEAIMEEARGGDGDGKGEEGWRARCQPRDSAKIGLQVKYVPPCSSESSSTRESSNFKPERKRLSSGMGAFHFCAFQK